MAPLLLIACAGAWRLDFTQLALAAALAQAPTCLAGDAAYRLRLCGAAPTAVIAANNVGHKKKVFRKESKIRYRSTGLVRLVENASGNASKAIVARVSSTDWPGVAGPMYMHCKLPSL